jgi:hypothetical protein
MTASFAARTVGWLAAGLALATAVGCASTTSGTGTFAGASQTKPRPTLPSGSQAPSGFPTGLPSGSGLPSGLPTDLPSGFPTDSSTADPPAQSGSNTNSICSALTSSQLQAAFGGPAAAQSDGGSSICTFAAAGGSPSIPVNELATESFSVTAQGQSEGIAQSIQIGGHPGIITKSSDVLVGESQDPSQPGILKAYTSGDSTEQQIAIKLLTALIPKFSH